MFATEAMNSDEHTGETENTDDDNDDDKGEELMEICPDEESEDAQHYWLVMIHLFRTK